MSSIAHAKAVLKRPGSGRAGFLREYLRAEDLTAALTAAAYHGRERIWTPMQTFWTFLVQVLHPGSSCRAAVAEVLAEQTAAGRVVHASADPSAYCQAREHLPLSVCRQMLQRVGRTVQTKVGDAYRWYGRRVWVVDGSSCSMPDTPALTWQAAEEHDRRLHRLSFAGTMQRFEAVVPYLWLFAGTPKARRLYPLLLSWIAKDTLPNRPHRLEPRALKRRPKPYKLLNRPRNEMRNALLR